MKCRRIRSSNQGPTRDSSPCLKAGDSSLVWLIAVDRFFPSTKRCNACGLINNDLTLKDRQWVCECGAEHDRDLNAAKNILEEELRMLVAGCGGQLKRSGSRCKTRESGQSVLN